MPPTPSLPPDLQEPVDVRRAVIEVDAHPDALAAEGHLHAALLHAFHLRFVNLDERSQDLSSAVTPAGGGQFGWRFVLSHSGSRGYLDPDGLGSITRR